MKKQARYQGVIDYFLANVPIAETELTYDNPFQLLVAVILSAQCTDKRVNLTTPGIFKKYPDPASMSKASFDDLFPLVRSISYPNKTPHWHEPIIDQHFQWRSANDNRGFSKITWRGS